jgi:hypothetical protein
MTGRRKMIGMDASGLESFLSVLPIRDQSNQYPEAVFD